MEVKQSVLFFNSSSTCTVVSFNKKFQVINISNRSENILLIRFYLFILKYLSTVAGAAGVGSAMLSAGMLTGGGSTTTGEATVAFADRTAPLSILLVSVVT